MDAIRPMRARDIKRRLARSHGYSAEELARIIHMTPREQRTIERALERFRFAVPPYYASLIDPNEPECPIRLQSVPGEGELNFTDFDIEDPLNEEGDAVAPGSGATNPFVEILKLMWEGSKPVIVAVNGHAFGGGSVVTCAPDRPTPRGRWLMRCWTTTGK